MARLQTKFQLAIFAAIVAAPLAADAADLYHASPAPSYAPPAAYVDSNSWAGFYAGINGGYGWNSGGNSIGYNDGGAGFIGGTDASGAPQPYGGFGGGQIGYNFQSGSFVFGVETDIQGGTISDRASGLTVNGNDFSSRESIDWFGTVRGRVGYAFGRVLVYGTGGVAYGGVREGALVTISVYRPRQSDAERHRFDRGFGHGRGSRKQLFDRTPRFELPLRWRPRAYEMI